MAEEFVILVDENDNPVVLAAGETITLALAYDDAGGASEAVAISAGARD